MSTEQCPALPDVGRVASRNVRDTRARAEAWDQDVTLPAWVLVAGSKGETIFYPFLLYDVECRT